MLNSEERKSFAKELQHAVQADMSSNV